MIILGLTGSVGMGKIDRRPRCCAACGIPVHDADAAVHRLLGRGGPGGGRGRRGLSRAC